MTNIEDYLFQIYNPTQNKRLYNKIYYQKYKQMILDYNNKRYNYRLKKGDVKYNKETYIIKFN